MDASWALGLGALLGHEAEWVFTATAIVFGASALVLGWRRHRSARVAALLGLGIVGLLASRGIEMSGGHDDHHAEAAHAAAAHHAAADAQDAHDAHPEAGFAHAAGTAVGVLAGLMLLFGHLLNLRVARREPDGCPAECCT